ncbi:nicotinate-nucleotide adenylyltransferase [Hippea maritima]|uniref:Probable nicotinate-nucleotide adenylyltransferase n=1 Tax=Hippea maritima (strain ATCC 700847 / DSM 10411 / MH2) TaxID=760142 RepID=F2LXZ9_HIPMA|nr:nicotinate-nucleotide adenylyltransferase [Hippea maritima]AEA33264.1 nicotinate-nucleotide adenylyltransferase [Hippea maritima DSM 10411]
MRIAIFGGSFNPIHIGHLRGAISVYETFLLNKVVFMPAGNPPHKRVEQTTPQQRYQMVKLATEGMDFFEVSRLEIDKKDVNYTIETVYEFRKDHLNDELFFIVGTDAFYQLDSWKNHKELVGAITFILIKRPEYNTSAILEKYSDIVDFKRVEKKGEYKAEKNTVYIYTPPAFDVSSSIIRNKIKQGECIRYLLPEKVEKFIKEKGLYR